MTELSIRALTKRYGSVTAVHNATIDAANGELISLLGPSGCGKTTTLRLAAGFEQPDSGTILFDGKDVSNLLPEHRDIGMVFQNYALFPHMTVLENCRFGLEMRKIPKDQASVRITRALEMVQLVGREQRYPRELSGGQQQRVALARALVIEPAILLLDEPLANLDAVLREEMRFFIRSLQQKVGITTLYVTHDQAEALLISDRVAVMFDGCIEQIGAPREIYERPRSRRTASFVGLSNFLEGQVIRHDASNAIIHATSGSLAATHAGAVRDGQTVTILVRPERIDIRLGPGDEGELISSAMNVRRGTITELYFLGNVLDCRVAINEGGSLQVHARPGMPLGKGDQVTLSFPASAAWVVTE
jgi:putative spermidine/putrescine transport system ATP-binding protein